MRTIILVLLTGVLVLYPDTLFEVKDASNNKVLDVSTDGLRVLNQGDTLMVISSSEIKASIMDDAQKGLSRTFSVTTTQSKGKGLANALEVASNYTTMSDGTGNYIDFSPLNLFLGLNSGQNTVPNPNPFSAGDQTTWEGKFNIFIGNESGKNNVTGYFNLFVGDKAGQQNNGGQKNTFVGSQSGQANVSGGYNSHFGYNSGITSTGYNNVFIGANCGFNNSDKSANTYVGTASGEYFRGSSNTFLGYCAGRNASTVRTGDGNVFIGYNAGSSSGSVSNNLYIANSSTNTPLIKGTFPNTDLTFTANTVSVVHPIGTSYGLYLQDTYNGNTDNWHLYMYSDDNLGLFYNTTEVGEWNYSTGVYSALSDKRLKKDITDLENLNDKVMQLQPKRYYFSTDKNDEKQHIGLIAQDVQKIFPEFVYYNEESDTYTMDYAGLSVIAIQAVKEQQEIISDQESRIKKLEDVVQQLLAK